MRILLRRASLLVLTVAVLAAACAGDPDDAEVLGLVIEQSPSPSPSAEGDTAPPAEASPDARLPEPSTEVRPPARPTSTPVAEPLRRSTPTPPPPQPDPDAETATPAWAVPDGHTGEGGTVWQVVEEQQADGTVTRSWTETSSTSLEPPAEGAPQRNPLRVTLPSGGGPDDPERDAVCSGGLHADDEVAIAAEGTIELELVVDGVTVASTLTPVDLVIEPGSGIAAADLAGPVEVQLSDTSTVECVVAFHAG